MTHEGNEPQLRHTFPEAPQLRAGKLRAAIEARKERDALHSRVSSIPETAVESDRGNLRAVLTPPEDSSEWITLAPPTDLADRMIDVIDKGLPEDK